MFILRALISKGGALGSGFVIAVLLTYFLGQWSKVCPKPPVPKPCEPVIKVKTVEVRSEVVKPVIKVIEKKNTREAALRAEINRLKVKASQRVRTSQPAQGCPKSCVTLDGGDVELINKARAATENQ